MAELDPEQEAALRRLRAAFGFVEVLEVVEYKVSAYTFTCRLAYGFTCRSA
jgi:hypothetical protein